ncbi:hypothetical protein [Aliiroseovarius sp. F20344]|uniref:hypothetical protein n=1 Tax=Aliiroseovarius sp. F20344 TaxID=2926414 RepID=UPI001FF1D675|nr:hypothetical protein [Aliiroseovarius sp. F20344]MCK0141286.1 hypothetical protein [Aliiroseovarius sp. F20344]
MIRNSMLSSFVKLILSGVLAATLTAMPVQARDKTSGDDSAAIIAALLGLVTLGVLLSGNDDEPSYPGGHITNPYKPTHPHRPHGVTTFRKLPSNCLREYRTQTGRKIMFGNKCLQKRFKYAHELPRACQNTVVVRNRKGVYVARRGYVPACLSKRGYRATRRY